MEALGWILLLTVWAFTVMNYNNLPDIIPVHYDLSGAADRFGSKNHILALPFIATILFVASTILNRFPHVLNYPTPITKTNALMQYTNATRMIRYLKLAIVIIFGLIVFQTIQTANGQKDGLGAWFIFLVMGLIFLPIMFFLIKSVKG